MSGCSSSAGRLLDGPGVVGLARYSKITHLTVNECECDEWNGRDVDSDAFHIDESGRRRIHGPVQVEGQQSSVASARLQCSGVVWKRIRVE